MQSALKWTWTKSEAFSEKMIKPLRLTPSTHLSLGTQVLGAYTQTLSHLHHEFLFLWFVGGPMSPAGRGIRSALLLNLDLVWQVRFFSFQTAPTTTTTIQRHRLHSFLCRCEKSHSELSLKQLTIQDLAPFCR